MKKILFFIHDMEDGGAQKVLTHLVNNMDPEKFDITVMALFGGGVNEQFLGSSIRYKTVFRKSFPGNSHVMKLFTPTLLHKWFIKEHYDIEVSYLEGPSARIISGCPYAQTKLVSWIHVQQNDMKVLAGSFRNNAEAVRCYGRYDQTVCVSEFVRADFCGILNYKKPCHVLYNTVESEKILTLSTDSVSDFETTDMIRMVAVGTLKKSKGYARLLRVIKKLHSLGYPIQLHILGIGPMEQTIRDYIRANHLENAVILQGYQTNPYKYVSKCNLFVCASFAEGFSTAATEALIVGTPVCTVEVSGMKEMLGENNEWGIVTENNEEALYQGIKRLLDDPALLAHYKEKALERGKTFSTENTVKAVEDMLLSL